MSDFIKYGLIASAIVAQISFLLLSFVQRSISWMLLILYILFLVVLIFLFIWDRLKEKKEEKYNDYRDY
ncbi:hypothetical protein [Shouchella lonarensis]|uniref:Uncharacterized protein n=1 Tax=Shouchella lonarensis TaxID=1464122 RepID=A0A1G6GRH7_9BACI|nr:hypothetical protein [Shouchella lonarensis]SDB83796.1 hypothetical protein SAMN05421737_101322 [Shouchella lonarensis]